MKQKRIIAVDCETDPFLYGRVPQPFIWGSWDGKNYITFDDTDSFVEWLCEQDAIVHAHNGGKFDFMFLLKYVLRKTPVAKVQVIKGRIVSMYIGKARLQCSYALIHAPLEAFGGKKKIEIWKLERAHRQKYRAEIVDYLFHDCKSLYDMLIVYRNIAGTQRTIASNALAFAKRIGVDFGKTNHRFDSKYRRFFYGGRCECFIPGTHRDIQLIDIRSAYPYAMLHLHPTGTNFVPQDDFTTLTKEEIGRSFIILECMSHGAFPIRTQDGLIFPHEYNEFHITGWEYLVAKEFGIIENEKIISVHSTAETVDCSAYINHWYAYKARHNKKENPIEYEIGKRMQNALYGKTAQNPANYYDYKIVPAGTPICYEPLESRTDPKLCQKCGAKLFDHGWLPCMNYEGHEIQRRESLWRYKYEYGVEWEAKPIYKNVATGASITGFTRAHLLRMMLTIGMEHIIYCDTDGIVCKGSADLSRVPFSENIGDWELEDRAPIGHFAGKKIYGVALSSKHNKDGKQTFKIAAKGSRLAEKIITRQIDGHLTTYVEFDPATAYEKITRIVNGETVVWENPAPSFSIDGKADFVRRNIRATARLPL